MDPSEKPFEYEECVYTEDAPNDVLATLNNTRIYYGAPLGYQTLRNDQKGSNFMRKMCNIFLYYAEGTEFDHLMKRVANYYCNGAPGSATLTCWSEDFGLKGCLYFNLD